MPEILDLKKGDTITYRNLTPSGERDRKYVSTMDDGLYFVAFPGSSDSFVNLISINNPLHHDAFSGKTIDLSGGNVERANVDLNEVLELVKQAEESVETQRKGTAEKMWNEGTLSTILGRAQQLRRLINSLDRPQDAEGDVRFGFAKITPVAPIEPVTGVIYTPADHFASIYTGVYTAVREKEAHAAAHNAALTAWEAFCASQIENIEARQG